MSIKTRKRCRKPGFCVFPGYRWCGPGCSGPGAPINEVDACCKAHDDCLRMYGSKCACDKLFLKCLRPKVNLSDKGIAAGIMYSYMKFQVQAACNKSKRR